jgi:hypothetical protein
MQDVYARRQLTLQQQLLQKMREIVDPNERYNFLCDVKHDFEDLTRLIAEFEDSKDVSQIENSFKNLEIH